MHKKIFEQLQNVKIICNTAMVCTIFVFENRSYLGEFEAEFKKAALARESGAQGVLFDKKKT
jgi:hypothetical protein